MRVHLVVTISNNNIVDIVKAFTKNYKAIDMRDDMRSGKIHPNDLNINGDYDNVEVVSPDLLRYG